MIIGTGIDIIEVDRIKSAAAKEGFLERVFTRAERENFAGAGYDPRRMAGAFAAKEAAAKALGTGIGPVGWKEIEIAHDRSGGPRAVLSGRAREIMEAKGGTALHVSISHIKALAAAQAILEGPERPSNLEYIVN